MPKNPKEDISKLEDFIKKYVEKILEKFVISHTKITEKKYEEIKRREYWMMADEMLKLGIVDEII